MTKIQAQKTTCRFCGKEVYLDKMIIEYLRCEPPFILKICKKCAKKQK